MDEGVAAGQQPGEPPLIRFEGEIDHPRLGRQIASGPDQHQVMTPVQARDGPHQGLEVLFPRRPPGEHQKARLRFEPQSRAQGQPVGAPGVERPDVHAQGQQLHAPHAALGQPADDVPARRHHQVEPGVEPRPAFLGRQRRPLAKMQRRQGRGIGVAEAHGGRAALGRCVQGRMSRHIGVARLDQVGAQVRQGPRPFAEVGGASVAVAERQERRCETDDAARLAMVGPSGDHHGMAQVGLVLHPAVLGQEITFHTPAAGSEQHGGVDQVDRAAQMDGGRDRGVIRAYPKPVGQSGLLRTGVARPR